MTSWWLSETSLRMTWSTTSYTTKPGAQERWVEQSQSIDCKCVAYDSIPVDSHQWHKTNSVRLEIILYLTLNLCPQKETMSDLRDVELNNLDKGESYCFMVAAYIPSRSVEKRLGDWSKPQCSPRESKTIFEGKGPHNAKHCVCWSWSCMLELRLGGRSLRWNSVYSNV